MIISFAFLVYRTNLLQIKKQKKNQAPVIPATKQYFTTRKYWILATYGSAHACWHFTIVVPLGCKFQVKWLSSETLLFSKTVLTRIISTVRVPSLYPNKDNSINRDDDAKRSPLSAKHVAGVAFMASGRRRLMTVPFPSLVGNWRRWSHSERLIF